MSDENEDLADIDEQDNGAESPEDFYIDILSGEKQRPNAKKLLVQKVLRQLIESYGFDRADLEADYAPSIQGHGRKKVDIAVFRSGLAHTNDNVQRVIICKPQKKREKLRSIAEAEGDLAALKELMQLLPAATLGMWRNDENEEFLLQAKHARFEVRFEPLAVWPAPGENTSDLERTGGVIQVSAEAADLEEALLRCRKFLDRNLGLDHKDSFRQLAVLLLAKIYDETRSPADRRFWVRGDEPFQDEGQRAIQQRINDSIREAKQWQPHLLARGWDLTLEPHETSRVVTELARYNLSETQPRNRTEAFRAIAKSVMDGQDGRYPTPLNVAEMAVRMLDPKPDERIIDCACGTGTFLAMAATHIMQRHLRRLGTNPEEARPEQLREAQQDTAQWAANNVLGCDIDPFLVVASRMNLLFTTGNPGRIFRLDARVFPDGDLDGVQAGSRAMPLGTMDIALLNPWFSSKNTVNDPATLERYELGAVWERDDEGGYRNTGTLNAGGVPPEVLFIERALQWVKPGTGRIAILLPDGLLGNPGDEYVRWWILRHCEVLASIDLPVEPFKVTVKEYGLTPALASLLVLRRRSQEELIHTEYPEYKVFMAVVNRAGMDARGKLLFQRAPDGEDLVFDEEVIERVRIGSNVTIRHTTVRNRRVDDELPLVASRFREFQDTGEVSNQ